jgi:hypothetical protein
MKMTPCSHRFCLTCIDEWLQDHDTCPICRTQVNQTVNQIEVIDLTIDNNIINQIYDPIIDNNQNIIDNIIHIDDIFNIDMNNNHINQNIDNLHHILTEEDIIESLIIALNNNDIESFEDILSMIFEDNYLNINNILNIVQNSNIMNVDNYLSLVHTYDLLYNYSYI